MEAEAYERWYATPRGHWIAQRELELLLEALEPRPGESLLDVGCGTGHFTRALGQHLQGPITGVDLDPAWLRHARQQDATATTYAVADARALPFADTSFDLVVSVTALCFIPDERAALAEMLRVARRRVVLGLLNRHSLLCYQKGRGGGRGAYRGGRWHSPAEAGRLFKGLAANPHKPATAIHLPGGGYLARRLERLWPAGLHTGAFIVMAADVTQRAPRP